MLIQARGHFRHSQQLGTNHHSFGFGAQPNRPRPAGTFCLRPGVQSKNEKATAKISRGRFFPKAHNNVRVQHVLRLCPRCECRQEKNLARGPPPDWISPRRPRYNRRRRNGPASRTTPELIKSRVLTTWSEIRFSGAQCRWGGNEKISHTGSAKFLSGNRTAKAKPADRFVPVWEPAVFF